MPAMPAFPPFHAPRMMLLLFSGISAAILAAVFALQYGFSLHPCHLCILQRYPYAAVAALGLAGWRFARTRGWQTLALFLCAALFLTGAGIAFYHGGVERGIFPGAEGCTNTIAPGASIEELRKAILNAPLVTCDQPMAVIFGLSLAEWNALVYAFLTFLALYSVWRNYRTPAPSS